MALYKIRKGLKSKVTLGKLVWNDALSNDSLLGLEKEKISNDFLPHFFIFFYEEGK
jgi:hypothetical protein